MEELQNIKKLKLDNLKFGKRKLFHCMDSHTGWYFVDNVQYTPVFESIEQFNAFNSLSIEEKNKLVASAEETNEGYCVFEFINEFHDHGFGYQIHLATNNSELLKPTNLAKLIEKHHVLESGIIEIGNVNTGKKVKFQIEKLYEYKAKSEEIKDIGRVL